MAPWEQLEPHSSRAVHSSPMGFCLSQVILLSHRLRQAHAPKPMFPMLIFFITKQVWILVGFLGFEFVFFRFFVFGVVFFIVSQSHLKN